MFDFLIGILLVSAGLFSLASIFVKRIRITWRGTNSVAGSITRLGFSIVFFTFGLLTLSTHGINDVAPSLYGVAILLGLGLLAVGLIIDARNSENISK